jgi:hypothetical protein
VQSARRALHRLAGVGIAATFAFGLLSASNNSKKQTMVAIFTIYSKRNK